MYVQQATLADWQAVLDMVRRTFPPLTFMTGGELAALPVAVADVFDFWRGEAPPFLRFSVAGIHIACHFFAQDEIEFDLDPREVTGQDRLDALLELLAELAHLTAKPAVLTPENAADEPIVRAAPLTGLVEYVQRETRS